MVNLTAANINAPGTYISEQTAGFIPAELASFNTCYMLGTATAGDYNTPIQILDGGDYGAADVTNKLTSTPSTNAIALFFRNNPNGVLYFVRCAAPQIAELTIATAGDGDWSVDIDGNTITYTAGEADDLQEIIDGLITAINADANVNTAIVAYDDGAGDGLFKVRGLEIATSFTVASPTAPVGSTFTATADTGTAVTDFLYPLGVGAAFDEEDRQGFLIAPEAFQTLTAQGDRTAVAVAMENQCAKEGFDWMAFIDSGPSATINSHAAALVEGQLYTTTRGHLAYFAPYLENLNGDLVPPSAAISGLAIRRYRQEGFNQPPAGAKYPVRGVVDVAFKIAKAEQEVGNPLGINAVRNLTNKGVVVWGSRTRSSNQFYRFVNTRIILNVLSGTLSPAFDTLLFSAVDGQGVLFTRIRQTIEAICHRLWLGQALYGQTPSDAFAVKCDSDNNPAIDLEAGVVRADVWVVPVPTLERLLINVIRTPIGQIQTVVNDSVGG